MADARPVDGFVLALALLAPALAFAFVLPLALARVVIACVGASVSVGSSYSVGGRDSEGVRGRVRGSVGGRVSGSDSECRSTSSRPSSSLFSRVLETSLVFELHPPFLRWGHGGIQVGTLGLRNLASGGTLIRELPENPGGEQCLLGVLLP
ncbi:hypothetical protein GGR56DRAFT_623120 [Xylariaceae sp. FL0804]|nr:hypothetical protein GGR56DRAFT_623120 [Xylariaceae sp. FL0804]